ncbi:MAG: cation diffusion facilitator family transporter, partial [Sciscionella sp.]
VDELGSALGELSGVCEVHDLHVWTLTSGMEVVSAHLAIAGGGEEPKVLHAAQQLLAERYDISHATLQVEPKDSTARCRELSW